MTERELHDDEYAEFDYYYTEGLKLLGVSEDDEPASIVKTVDVYVDEWQDERRDEVDDETSPQEDNVGMSLALGIVWGSQIVRQFGWTWVCVIDDAHERFAVVSPDRSLAIYATYFMKECLDYPSADCTAMLAFNMQQDGMLAHDAPYQYVSVMSSVRRIIPKR